MLCSLMNRRLNAENAERTSSIAENSGSGKRPDDEPLRFSAPQRKALPKNNPAATSKSDPGRKKKTKKGNVENKTQARSSKRIEKTQDSNNYYTIRQNLKKR